MRTLILAAVIAACTFVPSAAFAQGACERQRASLAEVAEAGRTGVRDRVISAVGVSFAKSDGSCRHAYGFYDQNNQWHATGVVPAYAQGFYDRAGRWILGAPNGYYNEDDTWVQTVWISGGDGAYNARGAWVPSSATGYYDPDDTWVAGSASGFYDLKGRWVARNTQRRYDRRGRWIPGPISDRTNAKSAYANRGALPNSGYHDKDGRWYAGSASGFYDREGRWIVTRSEEPSLPQRGVVVPGYGKSDYNYDGHSGGHAVTGNQLPLTGYESLGLLEQVTWLERFARSGVSGGTVSRSDGQRALRELGSIRTKERRMHHDKRGDLSVRDEAALQLKVDRVGTWLRLSPSQRQH